MTLQVPDTCLFLERTWNIHGWEGHPDPRAHVALEPRMVSTANQRGRTDDFAIRGRLLFHVCTSVYVDGDLPALPAGVSAERLPGASTYLLRYSPEPMRFTGSVRVTFREPLPPQPVFPGTPFLSPPPTPIDPLMYMLTAPADELMLDVAVGELRRVRVLKRNKVGPRDFHAGGIWELLDHDHGVNIGTHQVRAVTRSVNASNDPTVPAVLPDLPADAELEELELAHTAVTDVTALGGASRLRELSLAHTKVVDLTPLADLEALEKLDLEGCTRVVDLSPVAGLVALRELGLRGTGVTDLSPLTNLHRLHRLTLPDHDVELMVLGRLCHLELLDIAGRDGGDLRWLRNLTDLNELDVSRTVLEDLDLVANNTYLSDLRADATSIRSLAPLAGLSRLHRLSVARTSIDDLTPLAGLPLGHVDITATAVSDLSPLANNRKLKCLLLANTAVTDLSPLRRANLERLDISGTPIADLQPLQHHQWSLRNLQLDARHLKLLRPLTEILVTELVIAAMDASPDIGALAALPQLATVRLHGHAPALVEAIGKVSPRATVVTGTL